MTTQDQASTRRQAVSHTPGPWTGFLGEAAGEASWLIGPHSARPIVAFVESDAEEGLTGATVEANARLVAAAPDLLALLHQHLEDHLDACHITRRGDVCALVIATRAAIAKAEGRTA